MNIGNTITDKYFAELSSKILKYIRCYRKEVINKILVNKRYVNEDDRFFFTVVLKTINSFEAANIFIRNFDKSRDFQIPLNILLRAILNDIIIAEYIIRTASNEDEQLELIYKVNFDHFKYSDKALNIEGKFNNWTPEETSKQKNEFRKRHEKFYNVGGSQKIKNPLNTSVGVLMEKLFDNSKDKESLEFIKRLHKYYNAYSKLEHYGELSTQLVLMVYEDIRQDDLANELFNAIWLIISALGNFCNAWKDIGINFEELKRLQIIVANNPPPAP